MTTNGNAQQQNGNGQSKALVKRPADRLNDIKAELTKATPLLKLMLPKHVTIDRMIRVATSCISRTPQLLMCTPRSIVLAMTQACALGLEPGTPLQLGYLVPFKSEAQFIPGYRGLIRLAIQSGEVQWIQARIVREGDEFEIHYGTEQKIVHVPQFGGGADDEVVKPEAMVGVYAVAEMKNGAKLFDFMSRADVLANRSRSASANSGPWVTDFGEMAKKAVVRRLCKILPLSEEKLARALDHQARAESGEGPDLSDVIDVMGESVDEQTGEMVPNVAPQTRTDALEAELAKKQSAS